MAASTVYLSLVSPAAIDGIPGQITCQSTGIVVAPEVVVTDYHCVQPMVEDGTSGQVQVRVHLVGSKTDYSVAYVLAHDEQSDKAILYVPGLQAPGLALAQSGNLPVGTPVWGLGNPGGIEGIFSPGEVGGDRTSGDEIPIVMSGVYRGDSGGAICNDKGEVVAIIERGPANELDKTGLFYATPVSCVRSLLSSIDIQKKIAAIRAEVS